MDKAIGQATSIYSVNGYYVNISLNETTYGGNQINRYLREMP